MSLILSKQLICISAKFIKFKDANTGEPIEKWKYIFLTDQLDKDGKPIYTKGYDTIGIYKDDVQPLILPFDPKKAKTYIFELREWNGQMTEKLLTGKAIKQK